MSTEKKYADVMLLYRIARYYYLDGLSQKQISDIENISRSQISRLLDQARECGIVKIDVSMPENLDSKELASTLKTGLNLKKVIIVPVPGGSNDDDKVAEAIATAAASYLPKEFRGCSTIGIGWGKTMYLTSLKMPYSNNCEEIHFVPLIGVSGTENPYLQINTIVDRISERCRARSYFIGTSSFREKSAPMTKLERERIQKLKEYWGCLDLAVMGLGAKSGIENFYVSEVSKEYALHIQQADAQGDILSQFFDINGNLISLDDSYERVAMDIHNLKQVKKVICLAGGKEKVQAIIAAGCKGYYNILVTDSITAKCIFDELRGRGKI